MLIQIHILQNYAPANLNRDDTGSPKDAIFGGFRRGRISSQSLKRSIRRSEAFAQTFGDSNLLGVRTRLLPDLVSKELEAMGVDDNARADIISRLAEIGRESTKKSADEGEESIEETEAETSTKQLIFVGRDEIRPIAEKLLGMYKTIGREKWINPKKLLIADLTKALGSSVPRSVDIAMFGRMTTSSAFENVNAAVQVAHAISTNALTQEFDYYTAIDDLSGEAGAGMIGDVEFNSSTYYKYLNIHWDGLLKNVGGDVDVARKAVTALVNAAATAQPSGKQNTFAAQNLPDLVVIEVSRKNLPVSYANAFMKPARSSGDRSLVDVSVDKLTDYMKRIGKTYGLDNKRAYVATQEYQIPDAAMQTSLAELEAWVASQVGE